VGLSQALSVVLIHFHERHSATGDSETAEADRFRIPPPGALTKLGEGRNLLTPPKGVGSNITATLWKAYHCRGQAGRRRYYPQSGGTQPSYLPPLLPARSIYIFPSPPGMVAPPRILGDTIYERAKRTREGSAISTTRPETQERQKTNFTSLFRFQCPLALLRDYGWTPLRNTSPDVPFVTTPPVRRFLVLGNPKAKICRLTSDGLSVLFARPAGGT